MRLFGFDLNLTKAAPPAGLQQPASRGREWWPIVREPFTGAWQRNQEQTVENVLSFSPLFRCVTLISSDIAKNRMMLVEEVDAGIWQEINVPAFSPVLRKPNHFQTRQQFLESWMISKLAHGNTYGLKQRDARGVVVDIYILDPLRTKPLVAPNGDVYYELKADDLSQVFREGVIIPASEIIHDRWNTLFHPLVGISPIYACGLAAVQGLAIQKNSAKFFTNDATAPGILTAPGDIPDDTAQRMRDHWEANYTGDNSKKVAVLGSGLNFQAMSFNAVDSQLTEQAKGSAESVCTAFGVPAYKIGVGQMPTYNNIEALRLEYYASALQQHVESIEALLDDALGLDQITGKTYGVEIDTDNLLRMDTASMVKSEADAVGAGIKKPNEARRRLGLGKVKGGDTPYLQQQNYSLAALDKRDQQDDPFASKQTSSPPVAAGPANDNATDEEISAARAVADWRTKSIIRSRRR